MPANYRQNVCVGAAGLSPGALKLAGNKVAGMELKGRGMRNTVLIIVCLVISLTFAFGVAELAVRFFEPQEVAPIRFVFDPQLGDIPTPYQKGRKIRPGLFDHTYSHNSLGLRGSKEYSYERQTEHRLLFLGDSFTSDSSSSSSFLF